MGMIESLVKGAIEKPMKVRARVKAFCYTGMNFGVLFLFLVLLIDGASMEQSLIILIGSLISVNLILWLGFRIKEQGTIPPGYD